MEISFTNVNATKLPSRNDFYLMDARMNDQVTKQDQKIFNEIRMHMKLITASDIAKCNSENQII